VTAEYEDVSESLNKLEFHDSLCGWVQCFFRTIKLGSFKEGKEKEQT